MRQARGGACRARDDLAPFLTISDWLAPFARNIQPAMSTLQPPGGVAVIPKPQTFGAVAPDTQAGQARMQDWAARAIGQPLAWLMVGALALTDLLWSMCVHLSIGGWGMAALAVAVLAALAALYRSRSPVIADTAEMAALWVAFSAAGCVLTYLGTTPAAPLQDAVLARLDRAMGFDWLAWRDWTLAWPLLGKVLTWVYASLLVQIAASCLILPALGKTARAVELLLLAVMTILLTTLIAAFFPVLGPFATFSVESATYLPDLLALRSGAGWHFDLPAMEGIVQMPSFHTILAVLFTYAYRGTGMIGWTAGGLNALMLFSIPQVGGHYLMDMIVGAGIAGLCILLSRRGTGWRLVTR